MRFRNLIGSLVIVAMLCFAAFSASDLPTADHAVKAKAQVSVTAADHSIVNFAAVDRTASVIEVAISPPDIAMRGANASATHQTAVEICSNAVQQAKAPDNFPDNVLLHVGNVPDDKLEKFAEPNIGYLGRPPAEPTAATARNGSQV